VPSQVSHCKLFLLLCWQCAPLRGASDRTYCAFRSLPDLAKRGKVSSAPLPRCPVKRCSVPPAAPYLLPELAGHVRALDCFHVQVQPAALLPYGRIAAVCERARRPVAQACNVVLVPTEVLGLGLDLEGAVVVVDDLHALPHTCCCACDFLLCLVCCSACFRFEGVPVTSSLKNSLSLKHIELFHAIGARCCRAPRKGVPERQQDHRDVNLLSCYAANDTKNNRPPPNPHTCQMMASFCILAKRQCYISCSVKQATLLSCVCLEQKQSLSTKSAAQAVPGGLQTPRGTDLARSNLRMQLEKSLAIALKQRKPKHTECA